jgi:pilus assembly protein Flp/PilA
LKKLLAKSYRYIFVPPEEGQGLVEYALILFLIAIVVIGILATIGPTVYNVINNVVDFGLS